MSATGNATVEQLTSPISDFGLANAEKQSSSPSSKRDGHETAGYEARISKIAKSIVNTRDGHREAMYRGAAECATLAHQIALNIDTANGLFHGKLKQHWERKKKDTSAIYQFLIQSAFEDTKQASKVFTATRAMFERKTSSERFLSRLKEHGGFDGLRKREAAKSSQNGTSENESEDGKPCKGSDAGGAPTHAQKLVTADIDPRHPKVTALYSRKFRSKIERLSPNDELKIRAIVWDAKKDKPLIRIISVELCSDKGNRLTSR